MAPKGEGLIEGVTDRDEGVKRILAVVQPVAPCEKEHVTPISDRSNVIQPRPDLLVVASRQRLGGHELLERTDLEADTLFNRGDQEDQPMHCGVGDLLGEGVQGLVSVARFKKAVPDQALELRPVQ